MRFNRLTCCIASLFLLIPTCGYAKLHDPTRPANMIIDQTTTTGIKIDFVLIAKDRKIVWINGRMLTIGDRIKNDVISDITPSFLILNGPEGEVKLQIMENIIKKFK